MNLPEVPKGIGWVIALLGLFIVVVLLFVADNNLTREGVLALFALAFLSRLIP